MIRAIVTDVCLPDYFSGDSRPWICAPIYHHMPIIEMRDRLHDEINQGAFGGNFDYENACENGTIAAMNAAIDRDIVLKDGAEFFDDPNLPNAEDYEKDELEYTCNLYVVFIDDGE